MERLYEDFFRKLLENADNVSGYVDSLYEDGQYSEEDLNQIFGALKKQGLITCMYADNRTWVHSITFKGKHYFGEEQKMSEKQPKIFISHSSKDADYVAQIVNLLDGMGLNQTQVFCSSLPGYGIPIDTNIFDYLRDQFLLFDLHVIFVHSDNYYKSPVILKINQYNWELLKEFVNSANVTQLSDETNKDFADLKDRAKRENNIANLWGIKSKADSVCQNYILNESVRISHGNTLELARIPRGNLKRLLSSVENDGLKWITYTDMRYETHYNPPNGLKPSRTERNEAADGKLAIRQVPAYDPDAQVSSLALTIPSWASSIKRVTDATDFSKISNAARNRLMRNLAILSSSIEIIRQAIEEE